MPLMSDSTNNGGEVTGADIPMSPTYAKLITVSPNRRCPIRARRWHDHLLYTSYATQTVENSSVSNDLRGHPSIAKPEKTVFKFLISFHLRNMIISILIIKFLDNSITIYSGLKTFLITCYRI